MKRILLFAALVILAAVLGYFLSSRPDADNGTIELVTKPCQLAEKPCVAQSGSYSIVFHLPEKIEYLKMFEVEVETKGWAEDEIKKVDVEFSMVGMSMGENRFILNKRPADTGSNRFHGSAVLPVCVTGRVDWIAHVRLTTTSGSYVANYPFSVTK